jgi:hypothetical protein
MPEQGVSCENVVMAVRSKALDMLNRNFKLSLSMHVEQYAGEWAALRNGKVVRHGSGLLPVYKDAIKKV